MEIASVQRSKTLIVRIYSRYGQQQQQKTRFFVSSNFTSLHEMF